MGSAGFCVGAPLLVVAAGAETVGVDGLAGSSFGTTVGENLIGSLRAGAGSVFSGTLVAAVSAPSIVSLLRRLREVLEPPLVSL